MNKGHNSLVLNLDDSKTLYTNFSPRKFNKLQDFRAQPLIFGVSFLKMYASDL